MTTKIEGYVSKVIYSKLQNNVYDEQDEPNEGMLQTYYVILLVLDKEFNEYKVKGQSIMNPEINDIVVCNCNKDNKSNDFISTGLINLELPSNEKHVIDRLLTSQLKIDGIGKKAIENFVNNNKGNIWKLQKGKNQIDEKIIEKIKEYIYEKTKGQKDFEEVLHISKFMECYYSVSLSPNEIMKIKEKYDVLDITYPLNNDIIKDSILYLVGILSEEKLQKICKVIKIDTKTGLRMTILHALYKEVSEGNPCVSREKFKDNVLNEVKYLTDNKFVCEYENHLYLYKEHFYEQQIASLMFNYKCKLGNSVDETNINNNSSVKILNSDQKMGVLNAFNNVFSVITGFPGVGKTTTVKGIKSLCDGTNENIVILAPTGKCVLKITNDLNDEDFNQVYTIHKFVNFLKRINTESYKKLKVKNLSHIEHIDMLVIDEMSMITNKLFYEMFSELIESCDRLPRIVFIGDVDQLPAIGTGNVLSSLISSDCFPVVKLTKPMRNDGELYNNILRIREDKELKFNENNFRYIKNNSLEHCKILMKNKLEDLLDFPDINFDDMMLITPTNANIRYFTNDVRKMVNKNYKGDEENKLIIGDYVMMKTNCYAKNVSNGQSIIYSDEIRKTKCKNCKGCNKCISIKVDNMKDLFNGMIGIIVEINEGYYKVHFENNTNRVIAYFSEEGAIIYLRLSYVNTIHKYQGSENKIAVVLLTEKDHVSKNMLYTAVSRAKEKCIIISHDYTFSRALKVKCIRVSKLDSMISNVFMERRVNKPNNDIPQKTQKTNKKDAQIIKGKIQTILIDNKGKSWSNEEDRKLLEEVKKGIKYEIIAKNHGRTIGSIKSRYIKITSEYYNNN